MNEKLSRRAIHYLETSGVNYLAEHMDNFEFNKYFQDALQVDLCISSVTLWEVLLNSQDLKKDKLIYWMQFNCANYLLKSPSEIIIDFINRNTPQKEQRLFAEDPATKLELGTTWKNIHGRIDRTIPIDLVELRNRSEPNKRIFQNLFEYHGRHGCGKK